MGSWIKVDTAIHSKPEVFRLSAELEMSVLEVVGLLVKFWAWADTHSADGNAVGVTSVTLDSYIGVNDFSAMMQKVGWLEFNEEGMKIPNFDYHNGKSAKSRALTNRRVSKSRNERYKCNDDSVTKALPDKIREDKNNNIGGKRFSPPTIKEISDYSLEIRQPIDAEKFHDFYASKGWMVGKNKMKDWKAAVRNWIKGQDKNPPAPWEVPIPKLKSISLAEVDGEA